MRRKDPTCKRLIEVEAFPQDLPHDIQIDISKITKVRDTVFVRDLHVSDKVRICLLYTSNTASTSGSMI